MSMFRRLKLLNWCVYKPFRKVFCEHTHVSCAERKFETPYENL